MELVIRRRLHILWIGILLSGAVAVGLGWGGYERHMQTAVLNQKAEVPIEGTLVFSGTRHWTDHMPQLWILQGQEIRHLGRRGVDTVLSRDGKRLFYIGQEGLYQLDLQSLTEKLLPLSKMLSVFRYDLSPDGNRICFVTGEVNQSKGLGGFNVHVTNIDSKGFRYLTSFPPDDISGANDPKWSPDGQWILFTAFDPSEAKGKRNVRLWLIHPDGSDLHRIDGEVAKYSVNEPAWSPDGKSIVFISVPPEDGSGNVVVEQTPGSELPTFVAPTSEDQVPKGDYELYVCNANGSNVRRLTHNGWNEREPVFSPDGKQICFVSFRHLTVGMAGYGSELYLINVDGTNERRLTPPLKVPYRKARGGWAEDHHPSWTP